MPRNNPHIIGEFIFIRGGITNLREKCEIKSAWSTDIPAEKDKLDSPLQKFYSRWIMDINMKSKIINLWKKNDVSD